MNKKFNLLALAAAASACGALVLTSCGGGTKYTVMFVTNDLRNSETCKAVRIAPQQISNGGKIKAPNLSTIGQKGAVRFTRMKSDGKAKGLKLEDWSYTDEGATHRARFDLNDKITEDTILYPVYENNPSTCCLTIELGSGSVEGKWNKEGCNRAKIWDDNWFEVGASLQDFGSCLTSALVIPPSGHEFDKWVDDEGKTFVTTGTIDHDMTITATYTTNI